MDAPEFENEILRIVFDWDLTSADDLIGSADALHGLLDYGKVETDLFFEEEDVGAPVRAAADEVVAAGGQGEHRV